MEGKGKLVLLCMISGFSRHLFILPGCYAMLPGS